MSDDNNETKKNDDEDKWLREHVFKPFINIAAIIALLGIGGCCLSCTIQKLASPLYTADGFRQFTWEQVTVILGAMLAITVILVVFIHCAFRLFRDD